MDENKKDSCGNIKFPVDRLELMESYSDETDSLDGTVGYLNKYKMNHPRRGKAIIFNHFRFMSDYGERKGTASDVRNLTNALLQLGFRPDDIDVHEDLTAADISEELKKVQKEDHSDSDLLMVFVLTHGTHNDRICASDVEYPVEFLWEPFRADKCRTLAGKPKIFVVNACRGQYIDQGQRVPIKDGESITEVDARPIEFYNSYSIPVWSDFLYVFSTYKGYVSYRNTGDGSWYIQAFCKELSKTNLSQISFTDFLTAVNGRLSRLFESGTIWDPRKQIPTFSSTLTKSLYFTNCQDVLIIRFHMFTIKCIHQADNIDFYDSFHSGFSHLSITFCRRIRFPVVPFVSFSSPPLPTNYKLTNLTPDLIFPEIKESYSNHYQNQ